MRPVQALALSAVLLALAAYLLRAAARQWHLRRTIAAWPRVDGEVLGHDMHRSRRHYRPLLRVRYHAGARTFVRVIDSPLRSGYSDGRAADRALRRHPIGSRVTLWVNPDDAEAAWWSLPERHVMVAEIVGATSLVAVCVAILWPRG